MAYLAPMELQTRIEKLETSLKRQKIAIIALACVIVAGVGVAAIQPAGDATFDTITCNAWKVVDKDEKLRIVAATFANGEAGVQWLDKDGKVRISASTFADGYASVQWKDKDGKMRINAATTADGTVELPTSDLKPK